MLSGRRLKFLDIGEKLKICLLDPSSTSSASDKILRRTQHGLSGTAGEDLASWVLSTGHHWCMTLCHDVISKSVVSVFKPIILRMDCARRVSVKSALLPDSNQRLWSGFFRAPYDWLMDMRNAYLILSGPIMSEPKGRTCSQDCHYH